MAANPFPRFTEDAELLENITRKEFHDLVREQLNLRQDAEVSAAHLDKVENKAWQIVEGGKYVDPIAVELLDMVERYKERLE